MQSSGNKTLLVAEQSKSSPHDALHHFSYINDLKQHSGSVTNTQQDRTSKVLVLGVQGVYREKKL
jgi:hypothetical protein